jgi:lysine 2,3-aminomutase
MESWQWQVRNRITSVAQLKKYIALSEQEEKDNYKCFNSFSNGDYSLLFNVDGSSQSQCPIRMQAIPSIEEMNTGLHDVEDPLHEDVDSPVPGLTHRYPDRVLFLITDMCSMYCRHCTRRRFAGQKDAEMGQERIKKAIEYIRATHKFVMYYSLGVMPF